MDVGCPQCQTEYELDDDRVGEDGVTVKCTSCGHVFRVKKKQLVVTLPARGGEAPNTPLGPSTTSPPPGGDLPPATASREWKVRQASGNIFTCRDLTILQKWIIEGKVVRDDEISLTGETWKRLGNIPELASFFQIVEEAAKARALEALHRTASGSVPAVAPKKITDTWRGGQFGQGAAAESRPNDETIRHDPSRRDTPKEYPATEPPPPEPPPAPAPVVQGQTLQGARFSVPDAPPPSKEPETLPPEPPPRRKETLRGPQFATPAPGPAAPPPLTETLKGGRFSTPVPKPGRDEPTDEELTRALKGGGGGKWVVLILLGLAVGGGVGWYFGVYEPEQRKLAEQRLKDEAERLAAQRALEAKPPEVPVVLDASVEEPDAGAPGAVDAGAAAGAPTVADAGATSAPVADAGAAAAPPAAVDAGGGPVAAADAGVGAPVVLEQKRTFDWYLAQGERLRDREKPEQALDMYSKAMDLKPERVEPWAGKGLALLDMANPSGAADAFLQALKYGPRYGPAIMGLAEAYRMMGKNDKAIQYYERYLEVLPNGSEAAVAKNSIERLKGQ